MEGHVKVSTLPFAQVLIQVSCTLLPFRWHSVFVGFRALGKQWLESGDGLLMASINHGGPATLMGTILVVMSCLTFFFSNRNDQVSDSELCRQINNRNYFLNSASRLETTDMK